MIRLSLSRVGRQGADLLNRRDLFVKQHLTPAEKRTLRRIPRGLPQRRVLRAIMAGT